MQLPAPDQRPDRPVQEDALNAHGYYPGEAVGQTDPVHTHRQQHTREDDIGEGGSHAGRGRRAGTLQGVERPDDDVGRAD